MYNCDGKQLLQVIYVIYIIQQIYMLPFPPFQYCIIADCILQSDLLYIHTHNKVSNIHFILLTHSYIYIVTL